MNKIKILYILMLKIKVKIPMNDLISIMIKTFV